MNKVTMIGTGHGFVHELYNTCFIINDKFLIDTLSGNSRKNRYPSGDIVYNNTSLYLVKVSNVAVNDLKGDTETKRLKIFSTNELPENLMDVDLIKSYISYSKK